MKTRRRFLAEFKTKVVLEAIQGQWTVAELTTRYEVHPNQITQWKRQSIDKLVKVFDDKASDAQAMREAEVTKRYDKIGQIVVSLIRRSTLRRSRSISTGPPVQIAALSTAKRRATGLGNVGNLSQTTTTKRSEPPCD